MYEIDNCPFLYVSASLFRSFLFPIVAKTFNLSHYFGVTPVYKKIVRITCVRRSQLSQYQKQRKSSKDYVLKLIEVPVVLPKIFTLDIY